ncbi:isoprenylcysteine carboxylmethyltransferase family protein [Chlorobium sp. N1]|uniref:methyltransferase family protein n=1 Tax=Chlorobium sp. N1 TaxID=2491138 RepID=UPI00103E5D38|nr:isoprenylcysteine carboxylmethyltransferase family protein [Chlorobium sp. N1]TCD48782.1 isoprenylcysteine carboxylmethyltransferase family protein [Chlorobium sp. N1]
MSNEQVRKNTRPKGKRGEHLVAMQFILIFTFIAMPVYPPGALQAPPEAVRWAAFGLLGLTAAVFGSLGSKHLKDVLTPLPYPVEHSRLITTGIYSLVRHPLYSSQLFLGAGWTIFAWSLSHLLLTAVAFLFFSYKASKEEGWLTLRHPEYADYARRVKKFIPFIY